MGKVNIQDLKANFPKYLSQLEPDQFLTICRRNVPIAELRLISSAPSTRRRFGQHSKWGKFDYKAFEKDDALFAEFYNSIISS